MQTASRTHQMPKVIGTLTSLLIGAVFILFLPSPALTKEVTTWSKTTDYPLEVASHRAIVHDGYLYSVGGRLADDSSAQNFVASAKIDDDGSLEVWGNQTRLPRGIYLHAVVASDTHLYVIGGWDNNYRLNSVYSAEFQPNGGLGNWLQISALPVALNLHQAAIIGDNIYVVGGLIDSDGGFSPVNTVYHAKAFSSGYLSVWTLTTPLPEAIFRHGIAAYGNTLYVTGGVTGLSLGDEITNAVYYATANADGSLGVWNVATSLPEGRQYHESVVHDGRLFVIAGTAESYATSNAGDSRGARSTIISHPEERHFLASVISADINPDNTLGEWRQEPSLPKSLVRHSAVSVRLFESDLIYVIGGIDGEATYRNNVYHSDAPSELPPPPTPTGTPAATPTKTSTSTPTWTATPTRTPSPTPTPTPPAGIDAYETDNTCTDATPLDLDAPGQTHTFHAPADADWVRFDAVAGAKYLVEARVPAGSPADLVLELYRNCAGGADETQDYSFSRDVRLEFTAPAAGPIYIQFFDQQSNRFGPHVTYTVSVRTMGEEQPYGALIIVAGRLQENDEIQPQIYAVAKRAYQLWQGRGYPAERIRFLAADLSIDADGDAQPDVFGRPSRANLEDAITDWAVDNVARDRALTLYMVDHGGYDRFYLDQPRGERLEPQDLDAWLRILEDAVPGVPINVIIEACNSGSFIDPGYSISRENRVIVTSTAAHVPAYASSDGAVFSDALLAGLARGQDLLTAFDTAKANAGQKQSVQEAWLDDNGNGRPNEFDDGRLAVQRSFLNTGSLDEALTLWPPYVVTAEARPAQVTSAGLQAVGVDLSDQCRDIWAEVRDNSGVDDVWATIYPPSYVVPDDAEALVQGPPPISLQPRGGDWYAARYCGLDEQGIYRVVVEASDEDDVAGNPLVFQIAIGNNAYLPLIVR